MPPKRTASDVSTRDAIFAAAAALFSSSGFDGVSTDDIARGAEVNKAMIYYHYADKLALYRASSGTASDDERGRWLASRPRRRAGREARCVHRGVRAHDGDAPWMPAMMLREIAEGAPRLDPDTMAHMRGVIGNFVAILKQGQESGEFRDVHPILAYESIVGPIIINAARERVAEQPARKTQGFPLLVAIPHAAVIAHVQETARRMLKP